MRSIILLGLLLLLSRIIKGSNQSHNLLLIALDKDSYGKAVEFATTVSSNILSPLDISIYAAAEDTSEGTGLEYWRGIIAAKPIADTSVSRKIKVVEKVTAILEALKTDMSRLRKKREQDQSNKMICVSFRSGSIPIPSVDFFKIFTLLDGPHKKETDVLLLEKNLHLQSMSTWHDLMIMGFRLSSKTDRWLHTVQDTYLRHAQRDAFALLEPRFAIREACIRDSLLRIRYFKSNEISVVGGAFEHSDVALIKLICTEEDIYTRDNACAVPHDPLIWRNEVHKGLPKTWSHLWNFGNQESRLDLNPMVSMWNGVIRFRAEAGNEAQNADAAKGDASFPRKFCWQSPGAEEKHAKARVIYSATNITTYVHSPKEPLLHQSGDQGNRSVLIISSSKGSARAIDGIKYVAMSKMYYCKRHGYTFRQMTSNKYTSFFPMNMFETCQNDILRPEKDLDKKKIGNYNYGKSVMSKPLMIAEAMLDQFDSLRTGDLWTVWTDDDIWINPGWLYMPLYEAYLESVPKSKIYVSSNYRSAFTNIVAIRNNVEGRALVYDWISVVMSGEIECHGFDQAALQLLILLRTFDNSHVSLLASPKPSDVKVDSIDASQVYKYNTRRPFNYTCVFSKNVAGMGCDGQNDWSCDFKFEAAFSRAGFTTEKQGAFHNSMISSYSKGCANDYVPDFHIVTETADRPRLQCGLCSRLSEIESTGHWDGPKGGGNDKLFRGSIDGWFFNHKAQFLFWEAYMDSNACSFMNETEFIPECDTSFYASNATDFLSDIEQRGHHIVSLTDGYAFDVNKGLYCRVTHAHMLKHQLKSTYMKDYAALTARFLGYTEDQWLNRYRHYGGGEGRSKMCGRDDTETDVGDAELWESLTAGPQPGDSNSEYLKPVDKKIRKNTLKNCPHGAREDNMPVQLTEEDKVFESLDYCNLCKVKNANWKKWGNENAGGNRFVVSCTA